jgi:hypothetical protein
MIYADILEAVEIALASKAYRQVQAYCEDAVEKWVGSRRGKYFAILDLVLSLVECQGRTLVAMRDVLEERGSEYSD